MVTIKLYKGAFTQKATLIEAEAGKKIADYLATDKCAVIVNKRPQKADYVIQEGDEIVVREFYGAAVAGVVAMISGIITMATIAVGATALILYAACPAFRKWIQGLFTKDEEEQDQLEENPLVSGSGNQSAKDKPVPLVLGTRLITPYYVGKPYRTPYGDHGENSYYTVLFMLGYKPLSVRDIRLKYADLAKNETGNTSGSLRNSKGYNGGNIKVDGTSFNSIKDTITLEIQDTEECSLYPQKIIQEECNIQIQHVPDNDAEPILRYSAFNPMRVEMEIAFQGLYKLSDSGSMKSTEVQLLFEYSFTGDDWIPFGESNQVVFDTYDQHVKDEPYTYTDSYGYTHTSTKKVYETITVHEIEYDKTTGITTFQMKQNQTMYYSIGIDFTYSQLDGMINGSDPNFVYVRVQRVDEDSTDVKYCDKVYLTAVRTWCFNRELSQKASDTNPNGQGKLVVQAPVEESLRQKTVRLAMRIKASEWLDGSIDSLNCIVSSIARIWDDDKKEWSGQKETSNPASLALLLFGHPTLGVHAYPDSKIDLAKFGELSEYCDRCGFEYNGILTSQSRFGDVLQKVLEAGHAYPTLGDSQYSLYIDKPQTDPVMILNNHNILSDGLTNSKDFEELPDGLLIKFVNADADYQDDTIKCLFDDTKSNDADLNLETVTYDGITNSALAWRMGKYTLAKRKLRPETWIRKVSVEGALVNTGDLVELQDDTISVGIGDGGRVTKVTEENGKITGFTTDSMIPIGSVDETVGCKIIHTSDEPYTTTHELDLTGSYDITNEFRFKESAEVAVDDMVVFGVMDKITTMALCISKKSNEDGTHELTLVPYQEGVYDYDEEPYPEEIPDFEANVTVQKGIVSSGLPDDSLTRADVNDIINESETPGTEMVGFPDQPYMTMCSATQGYVRIEYTQDGIGTANNIKAFIIQISQDSGTTWTSVGSTSNNRYDYYYTGHPEASDFVNIRFRVFCVNQQASTFTLEDEHASNPSDYWAVDTSTYGTWQVQTPDVSVKVTDRTITLSMTQPARSDNRTLYGTLQYKISIQRPTQTWNQGTEEEKSFEGDTWNTWWTPATQANPYHSDGEEENCENHYRDEDGIGYVVSGDTYVQTMPLLGQHEASQSNASIFNTTYNFKITAFNEATEAEAKQVSATALATNIRDIVYMNMKAKEEYVWDLFAVCAQLGMIKDGEEATSNYWNLETGEFRVGDENYYIHVIPYDEFGNHITDYNDKNKIAYYDVEFRAGNFNVSSTSTDITGDVRIYNDIDRYNRVYITTTKVTVQHRYTLDDDAWFDMAFLYKSGVHGNTFSNEGTATGVMTITNATEQALRENGLDYGYPLLSDDGRVYHYDDSYTDQKGENVFTIKDASSIQGHGLVGPSDQSRYSVDTTPAILAYSPYYENAKCLYGFMSLTSKALEATNTWTVDFWCEYINIQDQIVFSITDGLMTVEFRLNSNEPRYNTPSADEQVWNEEEQAYDKLYYAEVQADTRGTGYRQIEPNPEPYFADEYNEKAEDEIYYNKQSIEDYNSSFEYCVPGEITFELVDVTLYTFEDYVLSGLYIYVGVPYNSPGDTTRGVYFIMNNISQSLHLDGDELALGEWYHFGIVRKGDSVSVFVNQSRFDFTGAGTEARDLTLTFNPQQKDFLFDELMYDLKTAEDFEDFAKHTTERKPWGSLSDTDPWFTLWVNDLNKVNTNFFDTPNFQEAVEREVERILKEKGLA